MTFAAISGVSSGTVMQASFSFWIKILAFTVTNPGDIFIFGTNLKLAYSAGVIQLKYSGTTIGTSSAISYGTYYHIGLSFFEDTSNTNFPPMLDFSVNYNIVTLSGSFNGINVNATQIPSNVVAIFAKLYVYNTYILGIHGFVVNSSNSGLTPAPTVKKLIDGNASITGCISDGDLNSQVGATIGVKCVAELDTQFDTTLWCTTKSLYSGGSCTSNFCFKLSL